MSVSMNPGLTTLDVTPREASSRAIAFVGEGQPVRLLFDAFPYTRFGPGRGHVAQVSSAVLRPEEVTAAVKVGEPVYKVLVTLDAAAMQAYGRAIPLQSGMALTADILLESRSFLDLLMDPLLAARGRFGEAADELGYLAEQLGGELGDEYGHSAERFRARLN